jgi:hypothetical protein
MQQLAQCIYVILLLFASRFNLYAGIVVMHCTAKQTYSKYNIRSKCRQPMDRKHRAIVNQTCSDIISIDRHIKFVCIVNRSGKLLLGQSRSIQSNNMDDRENDTDDVKSPTCIDDSRLCRTLGVDFKCGYMYYFYSDFLLWTIEKCCDFSSEDTNSNNSPLFVSRSIKGDVALTYFQLSECSKDNVILAIAPLDNVLQDSYSSVSPRAFLCVYFEPAFRPKNSVNSAKNGLEYLLSKIIIKIDCIM